MTLQLISSGASPFARKVRVVIIEAGLSDRVEVTSISTSPLEQAPALTQVNPLGKLPVLVRGDGPAIHDSRVITRYLDSISSGTLYPENRIWEVLTLEAMADGILDAAVVITYEKRFRDEAMQNGDWLEAQRQRINRSLGVISDQWMSHLEGHLNIGQIGVACALSYLDFRHDDMKWRDRNPALADWHTRFSERASMKATSPQV